VWIAVNFAYVLCEGADGFAQFRFFLPALSPLAALAARGATTAWGDRKAMSILAVSSLAVALVWYHLGTLPGAFALIGAMTVSLLAPRTIAPLVRVLSAAGASLVLGVSARALPAQSFTVGRDFATQVIIQDLIIPRRAALAYMRDGDTFVWEASLQACDRVARAVPPVRSLASTGIGILSYCFRGRVIDLLGLTDATIARSSPPRYFVARRSLLIPAHQRTNAAYVIGERPDVILIPQPSEADIRLPAILYLLSSGDFHRLYVWDPVLSAYRLRARDLVSSAVRQ
jgi:hypothetical protein